MSLYICTLALTCQPLREVSATPFFFNSILMTQQGTLAVFGHNPVFKADFTHTLDKITVKPSEVYPSILH